MRPLAMLLLLLVLLAPVTAQSAQKRCGTLSNPTPQNWWLSDLDAEWTISEQGGYEAEGVDKMPDIPSHNWVLTNGLHGYTCACLDVDVDSAARRITRIYGGQKRPLRACRSTRRH